MGLLGKIMVRIMFSVIIVVLIVFEVLKVATPAEMFNSSMLLFAIISANMLFERYLSRDEDEVD